MIFPKKEMANLEKKLKFLSMHSWFYKYQLKLWSYTKATCAVNEETPSQRKICFYLKKKSPLEGSIEPAFTDQGTPL